MNSFTPDICTGSVKIFTLMSGVYVYTIKIVYDTKIISGGCHF